VARMHQTIERTLDAQNDQIAQRIGASPEQTREAVSAAIPALLAGLQQQAMPGSGLEQAIQEDHDGSILDDLAGYLTGTANLSPRTTNGAGILEHVFGGQEPDVQRAVSAKSGLDLGTVAQLLPILAPIVMGMLGRQTRSASASTSPGGIDLGSILGGLGSLGGASVGGQPGQSGGLGDLLGQMLGGNQRR